MAILGERPERGFRLEIERKGDAPPWRYDGLVRLPDRDVVATVDVAADATVEVSLGEEARALAERVHALVRAVAKQAHQAGRPPARRIHRWRDESP
ncbi:MAG: hypothetical protein KC657_08855 [Myxococcales bacterium]|nr:hypothetical protein [Myxococcales bacterium]MCA9850370.1 hypothetical protein [Dehalococcoidia bacterium]